MRTRKDYLCWLLALSFLFAPCFCVYGEDGDDSTGVVETADGTTEEEAGTENAKPLSEAEARSYCIDAVKDEDFCGSLLQQYDNNLTEEDFNKIGLIQNECLNDTSIRCKKIGYGLFEREDSLDDREPILPQNEDLYYVFTKENAGKRDDAEQHLLWTAKSIGNNIFVEHMSKYVLAGLAGNKAEQQRLFSDSYEGGFFKRHVDSAANRDSKYGGEYIRKVTPEMLQHEEFRNNLVSYLSKQHDADGSDYAVSVSIINNLLYEMSQQGTVDGDLNWKDIFEVNVIDERGDVRLSDNSPDIMKGNLCIPSDLVMQIISDRLFHFDSQIDFLKIVSEHPDLFKDPNDDWKNLLSGEYKNYFLLESGESTDELNEQACTESIKNGWTMPKYAKNICGKFSIDGADDALFCDVKGGEECKNADGELIESFFSKLNSEEQKRFEFLARSEVIREAFLLELRNNPELMSQVLLVGPNGLEPGASAALAVLIDEAIQKYGANPDLPSDYGLASFGGDSGDSGGGSRSGGKATDRLAEVAEKLLEKANNSFSVYSDDDSADPVFIDVLQDPSGSRWGQSANNFEIVDEKGRMTSYGNFYDWYSAYVKLPARTKAAQPHNLGMTDSEWPVYGLSRPGGDIQPIYFPDSTSVYNCQKLDGVSINTDYCGPGPNLQPVQTTSRW